MKTPAILICLLGCLLSLGCRTNPKITMLEQECRMHEDRIYALQDRLSMTQSALCDAKQENARLREQNTEILPSSVSSSPSLSPPTTSPADIPPRVNVTLPDGKNQGLSTDILESMGGSSARPEVSDPNALPPLQTPDIPPLKQDDWTPPSEDDHSLESSPQSNSTNHDIRIEDGKVLYRHQGSQLLGDSRKVENITISKLMTGGIDADGQTGDEGVFVVVEPRDAQGRLIPAVGPISIMAVDPALPEEEARVARWNFSEEEVAGQFRRSGSAEGFHLEVRWLDAPPRHQHLQLFVRYLTADSRKLYAKTPIRIALAPLQNTLVARPSSRRLDRDGSQGWASRPQSKPSILEAMSSPSTDSEPRVASLSSHPIRQSIPPMNEEPTRSEPPASRPRPVWSPER